jgi:hypothetical protein
MRRYSVKWVRLALLGMLLGLLWGCATPVEIKQALNSMDARYGENLKLMRQYRELVENINSRHKHWYRYIKERWMLHTVLLWATTDPVPIGELTGEDVAEETKRILGNRLVAVVNEIRLKGLPARAGYDENTIFERGQHDIDHIIYNLPKIIHEIGKKVEEDYEKTTQFDFTAFDEYEKNVTALRQINRTIRQYLNIDVTLSAGDVREIVDALRTLQ